MITTRFSMSSASTRAISRRAVVFPTPGLHSCHARLPLSNFKLYCTLSSEYYFTFPSRYF
jgi:hypothetical protein